MMKGTRFGPISEMYRTAYDKASERVNGKEMNEIMRILLHRCFSSRRGLLSDRSEVASRQIFIYLFITGTWSCIIPNMRCWKKEPTLKEDEWLHMCASGKILLYRRRNPLGYGQGVGQSTGRCQNEPHAADTKRSLEICVQMYSHCEHCDELKYLITNCFDSSRPLIFAKLRAYFRLEGDAAGIYTYRGYNCWWTIFTTLPFNYSVGGLPLTAVQAWNKRACGVQCT